MSRRQLLRRTCQEAGGGAAALFDLLRRHGHLRSDHLRTADALVRRLQAYEGQSYGVIDPRRVPVSDGGHGYELPYVLRADSDALLARLRAHERQTLNFAVLFRDRAGCSLAAFGRASSAYSDTTAACAYAVGRIIATLDSCGELMRNSPPRPG